MLGESASLHARSFDRHSEAGLIEKLQRVSQSVEMPGKSVECGKLHLAAWLWLFDLWQCVRGVLCSP